MVIRRRRRCLSCLKRFTTFERIHLTLPSIIKRGGARSYYVRDKLMASMSLALRKRPVTQEKLEEVVSKIEHQLMLTGLREIPSSLIGEYVLKALLELDLVAYIRYASVYLNISNPNAFLTMIEQVIKHQGTLNESELDAFLMAAIESARDGESLTTDGAASESERESEPLVEAESDALSEEKPARKRSKKAKEAEPSDKATKRSTPRKKASSKKAKA